MLKIETIKTAIEKLEKSDLSFQIIGGLISKAVLLKHSREVNDIDIIFDNDIDYVEKIFLKEFEVIRFDRYSFSKLSTEESFTSIVNINDETVLIEGRKFDCLKSIKEQKYYINNFYFKGVPLEFQIAEKIIALFSIAKPEYKHLIDLYSFSKLDKSLYDKKMIKEYFNLLINIKNKVKRELKLPLLDLVTTIDSKKDFEGSIYLLTLQASYNYSKEYVIDELNKWLKTINL